MDIGHSELTSTAAPDCCLVCVNYDGTRNLMLIRPAPAACTVQCFLLFQSINNSINRRDAARELDHDQSTRNSAFKILNERNLAPDETNRTRTSAGRGDQCRLRKNYVRTLLGFKSYRNCRFTTDLRRSFTDEDKV